MFFIKYLPISTEINIQNLKEGEMLLGFHHRDKYDQEFVFSGEATPTTVYSDRGFEFTPKQILKLFVCTDDIRLLDKYKIPYDDTEYTRTIGGDNWKRPDDAYKKIGLLSSAAIWVSVHDRIKEEDIEFFLQHRSFRDMDFTADDYSEAMEVMKKSKDLYSVVCKIKCSNCQTFH